MTLEDLEHLFHVKFWLAFPMTLFVGGRIILLTDIAAMTWLL